MFSKIHEADVILVVDDNPTNLEVLSNALTHSGYEIAIATDGESAIEQINYYPPTLILLDVMMPGIDGFETCYRLKQNPCTANIPIIFMTALSDASDKVKGLSLGAVDYITKPFQQEEVLARVGLHLKLQHLSNSLEQHNIQLKQEVEERKAAQVALSELNQELEQRVADRTAELSQALRELQEAQLQLIQSEKLSSLGQLVAGIAHEINNPINFIFGNLAHIDEYTKNLLEFVHLYQTHYPQPIAPILQHWDAIDLDFLVEDLPKLLGSMKVGADRIRQIVISLRNFSRLDEADFKPVNIHEGIDSTLLILQSRLKAKTDHPGIQVIKEYGNLPPVECYAGQLNQVFMNIISNAIDALEERDHQRTYEEIRQSPSQIRICTELLGTEQVRIRIVDNGKEIPEAIQKRIFDPFFTTKPVGKGTGLGMSISYQIVTEKHNGSLKCVSLPGQEVEFVIDIPIHQKSQA